MNGNNFWRSVWKGIESRGSKRSTVAGNREPRLEPPRDYVVDADQGLPR